MLPSVIAKRSHANFQQKIMYDQDTSVHIPNKKLPFRGAFCVGPISQPEISCEI